MSETALSEALRRAGMAGGRVHAVIAGLLRRNGGDVRRAATGLWAELQRDTALRDAAMGALVSAVAADMRGAPGAGRATNATEANRPLPVPGAGDAGPAAPRGEAAGHDAGAREGQQMFARPSPDERGGAGLSTDADKARRCLPAAAATPPGQEAKSGLPQSQRCSAPVREQGRTSRVAGHHRVADEATLPLPAREPKEPERSPDMTDDLQDLIDRIKAAHRARVFAMEQRKRSDLALGSLLRLALGWSRALPAPDRARIAGQARVLIRQGEWEARGLSDDIHEPAYHEWRHVILATLAARAPFDAVEADATRQMAKLAHELPVHGWAAGVRGFGDVGLAIIVAEAGDLAAYPSKGDLWKRMGLAVIDGVRQGGLPKSASKDAWIAHGYNRQRRSRMWNIGDALIKGNGDGPYRAAYLERKGYERARAEAAGLTVAPAAKIPARRAAEFMSDGHIHRRAQRWMEKRLLRDLWRAWRQSHRPDPRNGAPDDPGGCGPLSGIRRGLTEHIEEDAA